MTPTTQEDVEKAKARVEVVPCAPQGYSSVTLDGELVTPSPIWDPWATQLAARMIAVLATGEPGYVAVYCALQSMYEWPDCVDPHPGYEFPLKVDRRDEPKQRIEAVCYKGHQLGFTFLAECPDCWADEPCSTCDNTDFVEVDGSGR